jgi:hypothetical protein
MDGKGRIFGCVDYVQDHKLPYMTVVSRKTIVLTAPPIIEGNQEVAHSIRALNP